MINENPRKFHSCGTDVPIQIAYELTFANSEITPELEKVIQEHEEKMPELVQRDQTITRIYVFSADLREAPGRSFVAFPVPIHLRERTLFSRVFFRRNRKITPIPWMTCARFGEEKCFGFSLNRNPDYLPLSYPGENLEGFQPLFVKFEQPSGTFSFVQIAIKDHTEKDLVVAQITPEKRSSVPPHLLDV